MLTFLYHYVCRNTNKTSLVALAVLFAVCLTGFHFRKCELGTVPDKMPYFNAQQFKAFICQPCKPHGRYLYAATQATLDVLYPIAYCTLAGILVATLFRPELATRLLVFPLLVFVTDLSENAVTIYLALTFDCHLDPPTIPWLAVILTPTKWILIGATVLTIVVGSIGRLFSPRP